MTVDNRQKLANDTYIVFVDGQRRYLINEFSSVQNKYVYTTWDDKFSLDEMILESNYVFVEESGNYYIEFIESFPVEYFETFKVLDVKKNFSRQSSIISTSDITPENLNKEFDIISEYMKLIQDQLSGRTLKIDAKEDLIMLPKLQNGEFWIRTETGFRASNFFTLESLIEEAFKNFFSIVGGEDTSYTFECVTSKDGDWIRTGLSGDIGDGIAVQKGGAFGTYLVLTNGFVLIPEGEKDDEGNSFVTNGEYYQSLTQVGKFSANKPVSGIQKLVFKVMEDYIDGSLRQFVLIKNYPHQKNEGTIYNEHVKYFNSVLDMQTELILAINQRVDVNEKLYKIVSSVQPIKLDNGFYAELLENTEVSINSSNIATNTTGIITNATEEQHNWWLIVGNLLQIQSNEEDISTNEEDISTNKENISTNKEDTLNNKPKIIDNNAKIDDLFNETTVLHEGYFSSTNWMTVNGLSDSEAIQVETETFFHPSYPVGETRMVCNTGGEVNVCAVDTDFTIDFDNNRIKRRDYDSEPCSLRKITRVL